MQEEDLSFSVRLTLNLARNFVHTDLVQLLVYFIAKNLMIRRIPSSAIVRDFFMTPCTFITQNGDLGCFG